MCVRGRDIRDGDRRAESLEVQLCVNFLSLQSSLISLSSPVTSLLLSHTSYRKLHSARLHTKGRAFRTTFCGLVEENVRTLIVKSLKIKLIKLFFFSLWGFLLRAFQVRFIRFPLKTLKDESKLSTEWKVVTDVVTTMCCVAEICTEVSTLPS